MNIPDDWQPNAEHRALAIRYGLDLDAEVEAFRKFQHREPIRNPNGAFAGFVRKHGEDSQRRNGSAEHAAEKSEPERDPEVLKQRFVDGFKESNPQEYDRLLKYLEGHKWWDNIPARLQLEELRQAIRDRHMIFNHLDGVGR